jgi:hypothetical protein
MLTASLWGLGCSGTVEGPDGAHDAQDAGADGGGDSGDLGPDAADGAGDEAGDEAGDDGADEGDGGGDASGDEGPSDRCPPLAGAPPVHACLPAGWTDFTRGDLLLLDAPSMASEGTDSVREFTPTGAVVRTVVSESDGILGMSDLALSPVSGHLFYSVSVWDGQIFEIREIDAAGGAVRTIPMPSGKNGGNIALAFDPLGTLYAAYDDAIYRLPAGEDELVAWAAIPAGTGIGEIDLDRRGNLYLTDPFVVEGVARYAPDGTRCLLAGPEEGLKNPYGLTVLADDSVLVSSFDGASYAPRILRIAADGSVSLLADALAAAGGVVRGLDADEAGQVYATVEGSAPALLEVHGDGSCTTLAGAGEGLGRPARVAVVGTPYPCE